MPYGQFVSSEPVGNGAYRFGLADGTSVLHAGPPAEDLNRKVLAGMPDLSGGMLAANDQPAPNQVADVGAPSVTAQAGQQQESGGLGAAGLTALSSVPVIGPTLAAGAIGLQHGLARGITGGGDAPKTEKPPAGAAAPAKAPSGPADAPPVATEPAATQPASMQPQAQGAPQGDVPLGYTMEAIGPGGQKIVGPAVRRPDGSIGVYVPPSRGSPGGLTALGKKQLENYAEAEAGSATAEQLAAAAGAAGVQAEVENIAAQQAAAEEQKWQASVQANDQQEEINAIQARVAAANDAWAKAAEEATSTPIDENRYMRGSRGVLSGIAMAMGAFGAILGKSPNFAQQFIEGQIEREVQSQKAALQLKGKKADNALGVLTRELGSLSTAEVALTQMLGERAVADLRVADLTGKDKAVAAYKAEVAARQEAANILADQARKAATLEQIMGSKLYYQQGRAGSSGGFLQPTLSGVQDVKNLQKPDAAGGGAGGATPPAAIENLSGMAQAIVAADKIKANLGTDLSEKDDPLSGGIDRAKRLVSGDAERKAVELEQSTTALAKGIQSAFGKSDRDAQDALDMASGGGSSAARARAADALRLRAVQQARQQLAGLPPEQQRQQLASMPPEARQAILAEQ